MVGDVVGCKGKGMLERRNIVMIQPMMILIKADYDTGHTPMKIYLHRIADSYIGGAIHYIQYHEMERDRKEWEAIHRDNFWEDK